VLKGGSTLFFMMGGIPMKSVRVSFRNTPERKEGVESESSLCRLMPDGYQEELEDLADAARISAGIDAGRMKTYPLDEVRKEFGA
jgi:hypothetical protein